MLELNGTERSYRKDAKARSHDRRNLILQWTSLHFVIEGQLLMLSGGLSLAACAFFLHRAKFISLERVVTLE